MCVLCGGTIYPSQIFTHMQTKHMHIPACSLKRIILYTSCGTWHDKIGTGLGNYLIHSDLIIYYKLHMALNWHDKIGTGLGNYLIHSDLIIYYTLHMALGMIRSDWTGELLYTL